MIRIKNVRNTAKFKRSIKAISPVIATLLMIAIAVVASLVVYAWVTGYMGNTTSKAGKAIQIQSFAVMGGNLVVYVQNVGQGDVELNQDQSVYVDSNLVSITAPNQAKIPILVGQTVELQTDAPYTAGTKVTIKVTTTDGTFMTTTGKPSQGGSVTPGTLTASVNPAGPLTMIAGQTQIFTASSSGGTGSKSYQWYLDGSVVSGETATTYTYNAATGSHNVYVKITDSAAPPVSADSSTVSITVTDALSASVTPAGPLTIDAGQQQTFTATATGGTGPYAYVWYIDGSVISGQTASTYTYTAAVGSDSIYCKVTDSASTPATVDSNTVSITINSAMSTPSITPIGPLTMTAGNTQTFTLGTVTGGSGAKSYQWYLDGSAVSGQTGTSYTYTAATTGSPHSVYCRVTDSASTPVSLNSNTVTITVNTGSLPLTLRPNGNGNDGLTRNTGSNNYQCVDETTSDADSTYVYDSSDNSGFERDYYSFENHGSVTGTINSVTVYINCKQVLAGGSTSQSQARTALRWDGNTEYGSAVNLGTTYTTYSTVYATNPDGGAWNWGDIDSLQAGVSLLSADTDTGWWDDDTSFARCTQVWVVVTYTP